MRGEDIKERTKTEFLRKAVGGAVASWLVRSFLY